MLYRILYDGLCPGFSKNEVVPSGECYTESYRIGYICPRFSKDRAAFEPHAGKHLFLHSSSNMMGSQRFHADGRCSCAFAPQVPRHRHADIICADASLLCRVCLLCFMRRKWKPVRKARPLWVPSSWCQQIINTGTNYSE